MATHRRVECLWPAIAPMDNPKFRALSFGSRVLDRDASGPRRDPDNARPGLDLSRCTTSRNDLEVCSAWSSCGCDSMVGRQSTIWNLRSEDAVWPCLRWAGRCDRFDGVDGVLCNDRFSWRGLERRKHLSTTFLRSRCDRSTLRARHPSPHIGELGQPIHERACTDVLPGADVNRDTVQNNTRTNYNRTTGTARS